MKRTLVFIFGAVAGIAAFTVYGCLVVSSWADDVMADIERSAS